MHKGKNDFVHGVPLLGWGTWPHTKTIALSIIRGHRVQFRSSIDHAAIDVSMHSQNMEPRREKCGGYNYDSTLIRRPFDGRSIAYQRSLRSQCCNIDMVTDLFIYLSHSAAKTSRSTVVKSVVEQS